MASVAGHVLCSIYLGLQTIHRPHSTLRNIKSATFSYIHACDKDKHHREEAS